MIRSLRVVLASAVAVFLLGCVAKSESERPLDLLMGTASEMRDTGPLMGEWRWVYTVTPVEVIEAGDPERYTLAFGEGGKVSVRADCNRGAGQFTQNGRLLAFSRVALTRMACVPGSMDVRFVQQLSGAGATFMAGDTLMIDLKLGGGTMRLVRGE